MRNTVERSELKRRRNDIHLGGDKGLARGSARDLGYVSRWPLALLLWVALLPAPPAIAHHSYAIYENDKTLTLSAPVEAFSWANPHTVLQLVSDTNGGGEGQTKWTIESSSPGILRRFGWTMHSVKRGDRVLVEFSPMRDGSHAGRLHTLTLVDTGKVLKTKLSTPEPGPPTP